LAFSTSSSSTWFGEKNSIARLQKNFAQIN
jgi:hypothetical protein